MPIAGLEDLWPTIALAAAGLVTCATIALLLTKLPIWPNSRLLLTPLAAQHRLTRLDEDADGWETAFAGELAWLASRGALRLHEVDDKGAATRIEAAGYRPPRSTGWEIEWLGADTTLPAWSNAVIEAYFPGGRRSRGNRSRVDRTGADTPQKRASMKAAIVAELDRARVDRTDRSTWLTGFITGAYGRSSAIILVIPLGLTLLIPPLPLWAKAAYLAAIITLCVLAFIRPPLQRRWTKLWQRYRTESQELHELPLDERGTGATRVVYLDAFAENLGFADIVALGASEDMARGYAQQANAMVQEGLLDSITPDWLAPQRQQVTEKQFVELIDGFLFTVR
ncbi:hypothetical protein [Pseudoclavibacter helvolus]|uniref:hypothetical protein n=1 Tax=Pseudoclavibacter helvolus TaxID=255205 RepID=UPI003C75B627